MSPRTIHIFYRHVHSKADKNSRDPNKQRPDWFSYERCFRNLLTTIRTDPLGYRVKITVMFDGKYDDFVEDFISGYQANAEYGIDLQFLEGGSDKKSALITLNYMFQSKIPPDDVVYMLENDYMHVPGWVSKVMELYDSSVAFDYLSLYDHKDKYFLDMYANLQSKIVISPSHHWRTAPSSCGSYLVKMGTFKADFDVLGQGLPDYHFFKLLVEQRQRVLLTPVPGLSTHGMEGYLSPAVPWASYVY
jgi:hypothetical protein